MAVWNITPKSLSVKGPGVSNSSSDKIVLIPLTVSAVLVREQQLRKARFNRYQEVDGYFSCTDQGRPWPESSGLLSLQWVGQEPLMPFFPHVQSVLG